MHMDDNDRYHDWGVSDHRDAKEKLEAHSESRASSNSWHDKMLAEAHGHLAEKKKDSKSKKKTSVSKSLDDVVKSEGERGGHIIGHRHNGEPIYESAIIGKTSSGKGVLHEGHPAYKHVTIGYHGAPSVGATAKNAKLVMAEHPDWSRRDHQDAAKLHEKASIKHFKEGREGPADQADAVQLAHRFAASQMPRDVKPRISKSLDDVVGMFDSYWAQQQAQQDEAMLTVTQPLNPGGDGGCPIPPKAPRPGPVAYASPPFRVDVLAPTPLSTQEVLAVAKGIQSMPKSQWQTEFVRAGVPVVGPRQVDLQKGRLTVQEFADAVGTTEETVRRLANRCGDAEHFVALVRDKMPDIQRAHSLSDEDATALYAATRRTLKSLTPYEFERWRLPPSFANGVSDQALADTIRFNGFMNRNAVSTAPSRCSHVAAWRRPSPLASWTNVHFCR